MENKQPGDDLFDRLNVSASLNASKFIRFLMFPVIVSTPNVFVKHCQLIQKKHISENCPQVLWIIANIL